MIVNQSLLEITHNSQWSIEHCEISVSFRETFRLIIILKFMPSNSFCIVLKPCVWFHHHQAFDSFMRSSTLFYCSLLLLSNKTTKLESPDSFSCLVLKEICNVTIFRFNELTAPDYVNSNGIHKIRIIRIVLTSMCIYPLMNFASFAMFWRHDRWWLKLASCLFVVEKVAPSHRVSIYIPPPTK